MDDNFFFIVGEYYTQGLALWRYSLIVQPEPKLTSGLDDEFMFVQPP